MCVPIFCRITEYTGKFMGEHNSATEISETSRSVFLNLKMHVESTALRSKAIISMTHSPVPSIPFPFLWLLVLFHPQTSMSPVILFICFFSWEVRSTRKNKNDRLLAPNSSYAYTDHFICTPRLPLVSASVRIPDRKQMAQSNVRSV